MKIRVEFTVDIDKVMFEKLAKRADSAGFTAETDRDLVRAWLQDRGESELFTDTPEESADD
jgi:hypothetical protein